MTESGTITVLEEGHYYLQIDYPPGTENPARIFRATAKLIETLQYMEREFARSLNPTTESVLVLERIEAGSLWVYLARILRAIPRAAIQSLDPLQFFGYYLDRMVQRMLHWVEEKERVSGIAEVKELQGALSEAEPARADGFVPGTIRIDDLIRILRRLSEATEELEEGDTIRFVSSQGSSRINPRFRLSATETEALIREWGVSEARTRQLRPPRETASPSEPGSPFQRVVRIVTIVVPVLIILLFLIWLSGQWFYRASPHL
jgi:hypothetical protein